MFGFREGISAQKRQKKPTKKTHFTHPNCWNPWFGNLKNDPSFFGGILLISEIRRENQLRLVFEIPLFTRFRHHPKWLGMGFLNHQQYQPKLEALYFVERNHSKSNLHI